MDFKDMLVHLRHRNAEWVGGAKVTGSVEQRPYDRTPLLSQGQSHRFQWNDSKFGLAPCVSGPFLRTAAIGFRLKDFVFFR